jgi:sugar lactone lactonase YvrE
LSSNPSTLNARRAREGDGGTLRQGGRKGAFLAGALAILLCVSLPALAFGDEPDPQVPAAAFEDASSIFTDSQAAAELPKSDLDRTEVLDLLEGTFEPILQGAAGPFDDLTVERFLGANAAVIPSDENPEAAIQIGAEGVVPQNSSLLLESTLPLRDDGAVVDLSLQRTADDLQPVNALTELSIPTQLGDGIQLPEAGVSIGLVGAPADREPSMIDSVAVYPNVAIDTDLLVAPVPTGVETFINLRSSDAPTSQSFRLDLPEGADIRESDAGVEILRPDGGQALLVRPPAAIDAEGEEVPVNMSVSGAVLRLQAQPGAEAQYPILVDPLVESYEWAQSTGNTGAWEKSYSAGYKIRPSQSFMNTDGAHPGLNVYAPLGSYSAADNGHWQLPVPRYRWEVAEGRIPTTYISSFTLSNIWTKGSPGSSSPYFYAGVWDPALNTWAGNAPSKAVWAREGYLANIIGGSITFTTGGDQQAQIAEGPGLNSNETASISGNREMIAGGATVEFVDNELPEASNGSYNGIWADQTATGAISARITDRGLGAKRATFGVPAQVLGQVTNSCAGTTSSFCPYQWQADLYSNQYQPASMPQGWLSVPVWGEDVLGNKTATPALAELGIDHTKPSMSALSGTLTQQASLGTRKLEYGLKYSAIDGFESPPALQKATASPTPYGVAVDSAGSVWVVDGDHNVVRKYDQAGVLLLTIGSTGTANGQFIEPRSVAIDKNNRVWITDKGNHRLQQFSSTGAFIQQITAPAGEMVEPYGIAISPDGSIWVSDQALNRVLQFTGTENGIILNRKVAGQKTSAGDTTFAAPRGLATDAKGNVWVADSNNNRLQKINPNGEIVRQIGTTGSGATQLKTPYAVAVTGLGHLLVADGANNRLQLFDPEGYFLRFVGASQMEKPRGVAMGPGNIAYVASGLNSQLQKWANVDLDSQSGVVKGEVLVDGVPREVFKPTCSGSSNCSIASREWVLKARDYAEGQHSVQVAVTDGVGLRSTSPELTVDLRPDRTVPQLTMSGSMTEQATLGATRPSYKLKVQGVDPEPKEGSLVFSASVNAGNSLNLSAPADVAVGGFGSYWAVDSNNNRLVKYSSGDQAVLSSGSFGTGAGQLIAPSGVAFDSANGLIWVADTGNNRIDAFNESGSFVLAFGKDVNKTKVGTSATESERNLCTAASGNICKAGVSGSGPGQLTSPRGVAVTPSGNIWVADTGNSRIQKFSWTGSYMNTISLLGSEGQLKEPTGVAVAPDGSIWVADTGNNRVAQWNSSLTFVRKFGSGGPGSREFNSPRAIEVDTKGNVWVADKGNSRVKKFDGTGGFLIAYANQQPTGDTSPFGPIGIGLDWQGGMYVADASNNRVQHWVPSSSSQSGVVGSTIKVDGKVVDSYNPGCATENCALTREWALNANSYSAGSHTVEATVTDGSGLVSSTKTLSINIQRDTTAPQIASTGPLAEAPEGWVEQKTYAFTATATDPNGYGVKQIRLLVDGNLVGETTVTACETGGCSKAKTFNVNAANYKGGAHEVAVIAEDGAGNWRKQAWTMNVDPQGAVPASEATDTLEAMEETVPPEEEFLPVASTEEFLEPAVIEAGDNPHFHWEEGTIVSSGVTVDTEFEPSSEVLTIEGTEGPIELTPAASTSQPAITEGAAAVIPATAIETDTVIRPEYNGAFMFTTVRGSNAPEDYGWHVNLNSGQNLVQYDPQHIQVMSKTGAEAWLITATSARDATGQAVPTTISVVNGSDIVLHLPHRAQGYTYPISAGQSYLTGYATVVADLEIEPPSEAEEKAEAEDLLNNGISEEKSAWLLSLDHQSDEEVVGPPVLWTVTGPPMPDGVGGATVTKLYRSKCGPTCGKWKAKLYNAAIKTDLNESWWEVGTEVHADVTHDLHWAPIFWDSVFECGARGPKKIKKGEGKHLEAFGVYQISSWVGSKVGPTMTPKIIDFEMEAWVYYNGLQQKHVKSTYGPGAGRGCPKVAA